MKSFNILFLLATVITLASCQPDNPSPNTGTLPPNFQPIVVRGNVDGVLKEATEVSAYREDGFFNIGASQGMAFGWIIALPDNLEPGGSIEMGENNEDSGIVFVGDNGEIAYSAISGSITVVTKDTVLQRVSGTFHGEFYNDAGNVNVTNGYFSFAYVQ